MQYVHPLSSFFSSVTTAACSKTEFATRGCGWEDSTLGNMYAGHCISADVKNVHTVRTGIEYMMSLAQWYTATARPIGDIGSIGFFQIARGIAGDFPICVVPMLHQDLQRNSIPLWGYFCQISDSTTSYGSYSAQCRTKRSLGESSGSTRQSLSSNPMRPLLRHLFSPQSLAGSLLLRK